MKTKEIAQFIESINIMAKHDLFDTINYMWSKQDLSMIHDDLLLAAARGLYPYRSRLKDYELIVKRIHSELLTRGKDADTLLKGLYHEGLF